MFDEKQQLFGWYKKCHLRISFLYIVSILVLLLQWFSQIVVEWFFFTCLHHICPAFVVFLRKMMRMLSELINNFQQHAYFQLIVIEVVD